MSSSVSVHVNLCLYSAFNSVQIAVCSLRLAKMMEIMGVEVGVVKGGGCGEGTVIKRDVGRVLWGEG